MRSTLNVDEAAVGDIVVMSGGPYGEIWDNVVEVDGTTAELLESVQTERLDEAGEVIEADACARCEDCRSRAAGSCNRCYQACGNCVETLSFVIPDVPPGDTQVLVTNFVGGSEPQAITILGDTTGSTGTTPTSTGSPPTSTGTTSPTTGTTP